MGRKLFASRAPVVDPKALQRQAVYGLYQSINQILFYHPIPQVGRQKHQSISAYGNKASDRGQRP